MIRREITRLALLVGAWAMWVGPALAADKIKVGLLRVPQSLHVGIERGYFAAEGIEIEPVYFRSGAELVPSLSTGQIDTATTSVGAALYNALAQGVNAKLVAEMTSATGEESHASNTIIVRKDLVDSGKVKTAADAKGLTMAITARGQLTDLFGSTFLKSGGLTEKDVRVVNMAYPDMLAALQGKAIDIAVAVDPTVTLAEHNELAVRFADMAKLMPGFVVTVAMYGDRLTGKDRDAGLRLMKAYHAANLYLRRGLTDPAVRADIARIYQKHAPLQDPALYDKVALSTGRATLAIDIDSPHGLRWQMGQYVERGLVPNPPDLRKVVDNSFAESAAK
jgi:NitT/TauT family transport system substrate-binding protein